MQLLPLRRLCPGAFGPETSARHLLGCHKYYLCANILHMPGKGQPGIRHISRRAFLGKTTGTLFAAAALRPLGIIAGGRRAVAVRPRKVKFRELDLELRKIAGLRLERREASALFARGSVLLINVAELGETETGWNASSALIKHIADNFGIDTLAFHGVAGGRFIWGQPSLFRAAKEGGRFRVVGLENERLYRMELRGFLHSISYGLLAEPGRTDFSSMEGVCRAIGIPATRGGIEESNRELLRFLGMKAGRTAPEKFAAAYNRRVAAASSDFAVNALVKEMRSGRKKAAIAVTGPSPAKAESLESGLYGMGFNVLRADIENPSSVLGSLGQEWP